ncbi:MAG: hypothetical protein A4E48_02382 [Methanosaeta sp. PtaU1.Bin060]|nr:MAG: hypothetical protein A4E48_02382 [Methanosaeta sp. PtaU1.Bin060]
MLELNLTEQGRSRHESAPQIGVKAEMMSSETSAPIAGIENIDYLRNLNISSFTRAD